MLRNETRERLVGFILFLLVLASGTLFCQEEHEIEVLGKKIPLTFDIKRGVLIIEGKNLQEFPARSLSQILSCAANMNFINRGQFQADPQIMGFNQEQILVMINGAPINNAQTGHHNLMLPLEIDQIERIEILRGGYSSLAGSSGTGGLINIITAGRSRLSLMRSSFDTIRFSLNMGSKQAYASAGYMDTDGYLPGTDGNKTFLQAGAEFSLAQNYFHIWGGWVRSHFGATNFYAPFPSYEKLQRFMGVIHMSRAISRQVSVELKLSSQYSRDEFSLFREDPEYYLNKHYTRQHALDLGMRHAGGNFSSYLGMSFYRDDIDSRGIRGGQFASALGCHSRSLYSLFGELSCESKQVFLNSGFRLTSGAYMDFTAQALLGSDLGQNAKLSASVYKTFRLPTYTELYYADAAHLANPELQPEHSLGSAVSFEQVLEEIEWGVKLFYNFSRHLIDWRWDPGKHIWISENISKGRYYGLDAKLAYMVPSFISCSLLYTWQNTLLDLSPSQTLKYHYYFPEHSLALMLSKNFSWFTISTAVKMEVEESNREARFFLNVRAVKSWGKVSCHLEVLNLFDLQVEKIAGLPDAPRSYSAGIKYSF